MNDLDALDAFAERVVTAKPREHALAAIAGGLQSVTRGFANALAAYIDKRETPVELRQASALTSIADKIIKSVKPLPNSMAFHKRVFPDQIEPARQCQKCSRWILNSEFELHDQRCPWQCGLCGRLFDSWPSASEHRGRCAANVPRR